MPDPRRPLGTIDDPNTPDVVEAADTRGPQVSVVRPVQEIEPVALDPIEVTNVDIEQQSVEFDVSQIGVPVLVRVSYFPNWEVSGAEGPYRIGPNQMVVVPTEHARKLDVRPIEHRPRCSTRSRSSASASRSSSGSAAT